MQQQDSQARLKGLFRELFQLDVADLDFGLYRLFRLKRADVDAFLDKQLPTEIERAFEAAAGAEREALQRRVGELAERARESVADDAILPSGEPNPIHAKAKAVKEYADSRTRLQAIEASEAQRAEVFNLLYAFFSRYYDEGDFIPRRFFGARTSYAIPYNGEEVFFYWANKDQYYVKSGEAFRDYSFTVATVNGSYRVRFKLAEATAPKDNTKGDTRFFFPLAKEAAFEETTRTFTVPFHYRLPTKGEATKYGKNPKAQQAILDEGAPRILKAITEDFMRGALSAPSPSGTEAEGEEPPALLRRRLTHFTKKNTTDYFVHKNLGVFLRQELESFVRDQVVHEADLEGDFEAKRRTMRVFRKLADTVITFLAQIEDAQKRLFEKKKFVLRTDYLVPVQHVPRALWSGVLANKTQLAEWRALYALAPKSDLFNFKGQINERVLEQHPTLVVDTRHFLHEFTTRLLETLTDLDEQTDGVLIYGENFQALSIMQARYRNQVKCIYIDPPYNTGEDEFIYKDRYQHSSWLVMMLDRIRIGTTLLRDDSVHLTSIGTDEYDNLSLLLSEAFSKRCIPFVWKSRAKPTNAGDAIYRPQVVAEFVLMNVLNDKLKFYPLLSEEQRTYPRTDKHGNYRTTTILTSNRGRYRRETMRFKIADYTPPPEKRWKAGPEEIQRLFDNHRVGFGDDGEPHRKIYKGDEDNQHVPLWTFLPEEITGTAESGKGDLSAILGGAHGLDSVKPKELIMVFLNALVPEGVA